MSGRAPTLLSAAGALYSLARPLLFRLSAQQAHDGMVRLLAWLDEQPLAVAALAAVRRGVEFPRPCVAGGVELEQPLILAAGLVKGHGFADEPSALAAVAAGVNVIPGWRAMPALVGAVELGSFTRWPRLGNPGTVLWRDALTRSTQNRVGLRNPGARAAAAFLGRRRSLLPPRFGINIAVSPGVAEPAAEAAEVLESIGLFLDGGIRPSWLTLNLSCPNTEDDPGGHQTEERAHALCSQAVRRLGAIPLWVKVGPRLGEPQYAALVRALADAGAAAVIATNTLGQPTPDGSGLIAGVGGGRLHGSAVQAAAALIAARERAGCRLAVIGCGGVLDGPSYQDFARLGTVAVEYWSALVYRGPLAAAHILAEASG